MSKIRLKRCPFCGERQNICEVININGYTDFMLSSNWKLLYNKRYSRSME